MLDILFDVFLDNIKIFPFLFLAFYFIEIIEHNLNKNFDDVVNLSNKFGPFIGSILGIIPQCGFSTLITNLYIARIVSLGTLVSAYLTCSDEMLPVLISEHASLIVILKILGVKFFIGIFVGVIIDFVYKFKREDDYNICSYDDCHCDEGIIKSSFRHTLKIFLFLFIISFVLSVIINYISRDILINIFNNNKFFAPFISSLIGMIPNCASSVIITELYLNNIISFSVCISGLLSGSGIAILVLFRENSNIRDSMRVLLLIYFISVFCGIILNFIIF